MQFDLFTVAKTELPKIKLEELFEAYFACRKNKRNTTNAISFEVDYEQNLVQLYNDINNGSYQIGKSIAFIVDHPVKREIFAARKKLAPTGWHVPTDTEWTILTDGLGGTSVAGGPMKEEGTTHWPSPNTGATNSSGFTGLPGGYRSSLGTFYDVGSHGYWWSSTEDGTSDAWSRNLYYYFGIVVSYYYDKSVGFSVRCLRD